MTGRMAMIEVRNLTKSYQADDLVVPVLKGLTFTVTDGELCAIMGPSGSGKSTLMNILGCLDTPTSGQYLLDGQNVATFDDDHLAEVRNRKIGFVFQSFNLLRRTAALEQVELPMLYEHVEPHERRARAVDALEAVGLGDRLDAEPSQLSGGQQQRVAIARALVTRPSLILADEPTGNLDSRTSIEIMAIFQQFNAQLGITILLVTHEPDIANYTRRILHIRDGMLGADEPVRDPHSAVADLAARAAVIPVTAQAPMVAWYE
jgi:putative ABC transport system ATP-binding protein